MKVFLMFVFCTASSPHCDVRWSHAIYPSLTSCQDVASAWLYESREWGVGKAKRKPTGILCETALRAPEPYQVSKEELP
jgi:hypothetical protein